MIPESVRMLGDVGASIHVATNVTQLLLRWDLRPTLRACGIEPTAIIFRWYGVGKRLGCKRSAPT